MWSDGRTHHPLELGDGFIHVPPVLGENLRTFECEDGQFVGQGEGELLELFKHVSSGMIFLERAIHQKESSRVAKQVEAEVGYLFVRKSDVPHVLAENIDSVRVFTSAGGSADLLDAADLQTHR